MFRPSRSRSARRLGRVAGLSVLGAWLALEGALAAPAAAQDLAGRYSISVVGGRTNYDASSALKDDFFGGVEARYHVTERIGIGVHLLASRPTTDGSYFPMVRMEFSDTVFYYLVSQQVTQIDYGVSGSLRVPLGRWEVRGTAGVGRYLFNLDDQRVDSPTLPGELSDSFGDWSFQFGGSVGYALGGTGVVELRVRDFVYGDFDRERFNVSEPLLSAQGIPHPNPNPPPPESTIHNLRFEFGFRFTLGGR